MSAGFGTRQPALLGVAAGRSRDSHDRRPHQVATHARPRRFVQQAVHGADRRRSIRRPRRFGQQVGRFLGGRITAHGWAAHPPGSVRLEQRLGVHILGQ